MNRSTLAIPIIAALMLRSAATGAIEMPQPRPGLWEISMHHTSGKGADKGGVTQQCLDTAAMAHATKTAAEYAAKNCRKNETRQEGGKWISDLECRMDSTTVSSHSTTVFSDNAYHTELTTTCEPPMPGLARTSTTIDGRCIGARKSLSIDEANRQCLRWQ